MYHILREVDKLKTIDLKKDKITKNWLSGIKATEETQKSYLQAIQGYTEFTGKCPEELIKESEQEIKSGLLMRERNISSYLIGYRELLEESGKAPMTVKSRITAICGFYTFYDIQLPYIPKSTQKARPELKRKEIPTKDDIREILSICNPLEKALLLVGVSSGLSVSDICNLRVSDFVNGLDGITGITTLHLVRQKTNYEFYTFLSPEATNAVSEYLDWRNRKGKTDNTRRSNQLKKINVTNMNGYLFIVQMVPDQYLKITREKDKEELRKFDEVGIIAIYRRLSEEARKNAPKGDYNLIRSHNLRRFFNSTLLAAGAPIFYVDYFLGHQLDATREAYFRADPKSLKAEYAKYVQYLTIEKQLDYSGSPEYLEMKGEIDKLQSEKDNLFMSMKEELDKLKQDMEKKTKTEAEYKRIIEEALKGITGREINLNDSDEDTKDII